MSAAANLFLKFSALGMRNNRMNRKKVAAAHLDITKNITTEDFSLAKANNDCLDLFYVGTK